MIGWLIWGWSNIAFLGSIAGLVALYWFSPSKLLFPVLTAILIAASAIIGGFGWGEMRYSDGRDAGAAVEAAKWQKSYNILKAAKDAEKVQADKLIEGIRSDFVRVQSEKEEIEQDAAVSNARILGVINARPQTPQTFVCEKANEKIVVAACPNPYGLRLDGGIVRNLQRSRNQKPTGTGSQ